MSIVPNYVVTMFENAPKPLVRDNFAKAGSAVLGAAGVTAVTAGIATMPRTTLGLTALAAGLLSVGNREEIKTAYDRWSTKREEAADKRRDTETRCAAMELQAREGLPVTPEALGSTVEKPVAA